MMFPTKEPDTFYMFQCIQGGMLTKRLWDNGINLISTISIGRAISRKFESQGNLSKQRIFVQHENS